MDLPSTDPYKFPAIPFHHHLTLEVQGATCLGREGDCVLQGGTSSRKEVTPTPPARFRGRVCGWGEGKPMTEFPPRGRRRGQVRNGEGRDKENIQETEK